MNPTRVSDIVPTRVAILGSTGSVGTQAIDALSRMNVRIVMLSAGRNADLIAEQARTVKPEICTMETEEAASELRLALAGENVRVYGGSDAAERAISECRADVIVHSIAGLAGLPTALAAAKTGVRVGMANKEAIISAGDMIYRELRRAGGQLVPIDSEHSAIFQCLNASRAASVSGDGDPSVIKRILLTASGGPFYGRTKESIASVTPAEALAHPTWKMGPKITVDSATLMNKGFEVIEACRLFGVPFEKVEVLIHRQSIIHSMVEYIDNTVIAQLGLPDMRTCVRYAVSYPERAQVDERGIDFSTLRTLTFDQPDLEAFPLLGCVGEVVRRGGTVPTALIAADEEAVAAFIRGEISFGAISEVVLDTLSLTPDTAADSVAAIYAAEVETRARAQKILQKYK
ncbi:MAG: 1-deoxy-D-xylulose-5-phosphate reductoisomerase [Clostridia bacterium]|nr:1-deoxy-D-xylulose-5-phosphate reductoisomerase [Clostridia bacterium]